MTLISVIVPVYKAEKYIERCICSILRQTFQNIEVILVDDGSPDKSGEICDMWALKDKRIKVIHQKMQVLVLQEMLDLELLKASILDLSIVMIGLNRKCMRLCTMRLKNILLM